MSSSWPLLTLFPTTYSLFTLQCFLATSDPCIPGAGAGEGGEGDKKKPHSHYLNYGLTAGLAGQGRCLTFLSVIAPKTKDAAS